MKIKAINPKVKSMNLIVPFDGLIEIDADGCAEVSEQAAKALISGTSDWKNASEVEGEEDEVADDDKKVIEGIKAMPLEEMVSTCEEAGYPEEEWKKFLEKKNPNKVLAAYLIKKYNESKAADAE